MDAYALQYQQARQQQRLQQLAQQVQQFDAQMQAMRDQVNAFENQMSAQASQVQSFDNALVGITPTVDPLTGESSNVWTGSQSGYWADGMGNVVNSATAPAGAAGISSRSLRNNSCESTAVSPAKCSQISEID